MPEKSVQVLGKSFQADFERSNGSWRCELVAEVGTVSVNGYGDSPEAALGEAEAKALEEIMAARRRIFDMLCDDGNRPTEEEIEAAKREWKL